jgi:sugar lactone lactonase YvrE
MCSALFVHGRVLAAVVLLASCTTSKAEDAPPRPDQQPNASLADTASGLATGISTDGAKFVANIEGLQDPESVRYDPDQDVYFISNTTGYGSARDGDGWIAKVNAGGAPHAEAFVVGGQNGVTLNGPKGVAIQGDTIWVTDIDQLRGFDRHTGKPVATIDFTPQHAVQLNDIAVGPDHTLRITDTGILMNESGVVHTGPDRIFIVGPNHAISTMAQGMVLQQPNGITYDSSGKRWLVVSFDPFNGEIAEWRQGDTTRRVIRSGKGELDGVEVVPQGILFTSWVDSSVHLLAGKKDTRIIRQVPVPADIGIDTRRNRVAIPLAMTGRVEVWELPKQ